MTSFNLGPEADRDRSTGCRSKLDSPAAVWGRKPKFIREA